MTIFMPCGVYLSFVCSTQECNKVKSQRSKVYWEACKEHKRCTNMEYKCIKQDCQESKQYKILKFGTKSILKSMDKSVEQPINISFSLQSQLCLVIS